MPSALQGSCPSVDEAWQALWAELDANVGRRPANARQSLSALWCAAAGGSHSTAPTNAARRSQPTTESSLPPDAPILTNRRCSSRHLTPSRRHAPPRSPLSLRRGALLLSPLPLPDPPSTPRQHTATRATARRAHSSAAQSHSCNTREPLGRCGRAARASVLYAWPQTAADSAKPRTILFTTQLLTAAAGTLHCVDPGHATVCMAT
eukprot:TRINITY_DN7852_c0_g1_i2.p1 TRINITY_DN7852_c0_g1~~TRINITY_DN7852_c0_g1_i2.p1  ORF type:complete len:226 (+),score=17.31 TRINITY_DN7852_c0_g1_i2:61-678(+)